MITPLKNSFLAASLLCASLLPTTGFAACDVPSYNEGRTKPSGFDVANAFKGRFDYPIETAEALPGFLSIDFTQDWRAYAQAVLDYSFDGNLAADFKVQANTTRAWYHAIWMHPGPSGREIMRGMTKERGTDPNQLASGVTRSFETWAIGFYNAHGATTFARVWNNPCDPAINDVYFPVGTTTFKLLFTTATKADVPYLDGAPTWQANIGIESPNVTDLSLYQIDIAVRDPRSLQTGWVFGTFVYQGTEPGSDAWKKLVPVGLSWGNDRFVLPGGPLRQNVVNTSLKNKIYGWEGRRELGWGGRLNGPADNLTSSCTSCHGSAQYPRSDDFGNVPRFAASRQDGHRRLLEYFRDIFAGTVFDAESRYFGTQNAVLARPLDYSLQLQTGLERMCAEAMAGNGPFSGQANGVPFLCDGKGSQAVATAAAPELESTAGGGDQQQNIDDLLQPIR